MRLIKSFLLILFLFITINVNASNPQETLFQSSTLDALMEGQYKGDITVKEIKQTGDFGLGTFNDLDGEMVVLDGVVYQIKVDGKVYSVDDKTKTPFVTVTFFQADKSKKLNKSLNYSQLTEFLDKFLPAQNVFYAIKIEGTFKTLKTRSVPKQTQPFPKLTDVIKNQQKTFDFNNIQGTMVGFRLPAYMNGMSVPGYHFHFISADKKAGGHVLDCQLGVVEISADLSHGFSVVLPHSGDFYK